MHIFGAVCATLQATLAGHGVQLAARRPNIFGAGPSGTRLSCSKRTSGLKHVRAEANSPSTSDSEEPTFALAPSKPTSPVGEMAAYYLQMQPHLFQAAVDTEFQKIKDARDAAEEADANPPSASPDSMDLVLSKRMAEVRRAEETLAIEDLMYVCILEKFQVLGVNLLPTVAPIQESVEALRALTEGVHTKEALEMVKEHVLSILGPASMAFADTMIKMSKLQAAQVYAASIMFGYFLRRVDSRFQLARQMGVLPESPEDAVARLERLFAMADEMSEDPDAAPPPPPDAAASGSLVKRGKGALRQYVESFDQEAMIATARLVTTEGAALVERQSKALFGDVKALQAQMQEAVGEDAGSMEELMQRVQRAVADGSVESVTMTVGTQRRAVLEAVAYGCFLRDVESWVDREYELLTPISSASAN